MIDFSTAQKLVMERLAKMEREMHYFGSALPDYKDRPYVHLVVTNTTEHDFGWVFEYDTKECSETNDSSYGLLGNAPFIVDRNDGQLYSTGTAQPVEYYVDQYRKGIKVRA